jgi:hypothetical protein
MSWINTQFFIINNENATRSDINNTKLLLALKGIRPSKNGGGEDHKNNEVTADGFSCPARLKMEKVVDSLIASAAVVAYTPSHRLYSLLDLSLARALAYAVPFLRSLRNWRCCSGFGLPIICRLDVGSVDGTEAHAFGGGPWDGFQPREKGERVTLHEIL